MSWLPDPFQLAQPPTIEGIEEMEEEAPPTPDEVFHSQFSHRPDDTSYHASFAVDTCRFDESGEHIQMARNCPHFDSHDEEGPRIIPGWTVQRR